MHDRPHLRLVSSTGNPTPSPAADRPMSSEEAELIATLRALLDERSPAVLRRALLRVI
jgi:hypothetical protein